MSRISEINNQIQSLKDQIKKLESEKFNINFLNMLDLDEDQIKNELKRISNMKVDVKNSCVSNAMDGYASNTIHELCLKYNYTLVNFISPGEVSGRLCNVELYYRYESNQTYDNRYNPDIEHVLRITMKEPKSKQICYEGCFCPSMLPDDELEVVESDTIMEYDVSEGDWGSIIKILINKHEEISEWNSFVEELEN
jgi:hypothetical protein